MWFMWFVTAFSYYGMVLASAEILQLHNDKAGGNTQIIHACGYLYVGFIFLSLSGRLC